MKKQILKVLLVIMPFTLNAQRVIPDSLIVKKQWMDKNGNNNLSISINAIYNPDNENGPHDGHETKIKARLKNNNYNSFIEYDDENFMMEIIMFYEETIWYRDIDGVQAVFIPFFYCCMDNTITKVSYIIFYNNKKYLYHFGFLCEEGTDSSCEIQESDKNLKRKVKKLPKKLKNVFIDYFTKNYKKFSDVFPSQETFLDSKFK